MSTILTILEGTSWSCRDVDVPEQKRQVLAWRLLSVVAALLAVTAGGAQAPKSKPPRPPKKLPVPPLVRRLLPRLSNGARGFDTRRPPPDDTERMIAVGGGWGGGEEPKPRLKSRSAKGYYELGHEFVNMAEFGKAIPLLEKAVGLKADYLAAFRDLGPAYAYEGSFQEEGSEAQLKLYRKAIAAFEYAQRLGPRADACFNLGILYFNTRAYGKSVEAFRAGIRLSGKKSAYEIPILEHTGSGDLYRYLGDGYRFLGQKGLAIAAYKQALSAPDAENLDRVRINLGRAYEAIGQPDPALASYRQYLEGRVTRDRQRKSLADDAEVFLRVGLIQAASGKTEESAASFAKCAEAAEEWIPEWEDRVKTASDAGAKRLSIGILANLKAMTLQAYYNLGVARLALNQPAVAITAFESVLKRAPYNSMARYNLGVAYNALCKTEEAAEQLRMLRGLDADLARELEAMLTK